MDKDGFTKVKWQSSGTKTLKPQDKSEIPPESPGALLEEFKGFGAPWRAHAKPDQSLVAEILILVYHQQLEPRKYRWHTCFRVGLNIFHQYRKIIFKVHSLK